LPAPFATRGSAGNLKLPDLEGDDPLTQATRSKPAPEARPWLERVCTVFARHAPVRSWRLEPRHDDLLLTFEMGLAPVALVIRARDDGPAWARTRSFSLAIATDSGPGLDPGIERELRAFQALLERADPGGLSIPRTQADEAVGRWRGRDRPEAERAHREHADELHFAAYVAWRALTSEDLYPHVRALGDITSETTILDGWGRTLDRVHAGTAPAKVGLYVHIPFCAVACTFCYCGKTDRFNRGGFDAYIERLISEMELFGPRFSGTPLTSVYFGGGTPSLLSPAALERVFTTMHRSFEIPEGTQVIFEGNPDSLSEKKIEILAKVGRVTRLTIGVQSLDAETQKRARRFNKPEEVAAAVSAAKKHGIDHVNVDLMAGLDGQSFQSFVDDLELVLSLEPNSIHLNGFRPQPWTKFATGGQVMSDEQIRLRDEMMTWGTERLQGGGFSHIDQGLGTTANAANLQDYDLRKSNGSLLGLGNPARSHSFSGHYYEPEVERGDIDAALARDREGGRRLIAVPVDDEGERHRYLVHNLHTGFALSEFRQLWGLAPWDVAPDGWRALERLGVVHVAGDRVVTDCGEHADMLVYRVFLYSRDVAERVQRAWGGEFDRSDDYAARLQRMCEAPDRKRRLATL
jgi:coproporphyrinogen III oxidase-like Fe-S oxidoreductase